MFSIPSSQVISELEVSPSNRVSRRDEKPLEPSRVELTVVSSSGDWMATVDRREGDGTLHGEVYVKIWSWDRQVGSWILNTRIDRPHGSQKVLDIAFSPVPPLSSSSLLLATTGADNNIKIWRLKKSKDRIASGRLLMFVPRYLELMIFMQNFGFRDLRSIFAQRPHRQCHGRLMDLCSRFRSKNTWCSTIL